MAYCVLSPGAYKPRASHHWKYEDGYCKAAKVLHSASAGRYWKVSMLIRYLKNITIQLYSQYTLYGWHSENTYHSKPIVFKSTATYSEVVFSKVGKLYQMVAS